MIARSLRLPERASFFLFGPRGTGKSTLVRAAFPDAIVFDLLDYAVYAELVARPDRLEALARPRMPAAIVIDEVQRVPALLDQVHRLIETHRWRFVLTGSSARKLRRGGVNLLAGRARTLTMHPLTAPELGTRFDLARAVRIGHLPGAVLGDDPEEYLAAYVGTYLREEVQAEALTRNLEAFSRFLVAASFSQGSVLSVSATARDLGLPRKTVEGYFTLLEDLLIAIRLPVFTRRARRALTAHPKFYFFDAGVYRALRPRGPLDAPEDIDGPAIETLVMQELRAVNDNLALGYTVSYWRTRDGREVDFVLYGPRGLVAIDVTRSSRLRDDDLSALRVFGEDYRMARRLLLYGGRQTYEIDGIRVVPLAEALPRLPQLLS